MTVPFTVLIYFWAKDKKIFQKSPDSFSAKEVYVLSYLVGWMLMMLTACFIVLSRFLKFSMLTMNSVETCAYIYSVAGFSVIVMTFPSRISTILVGEIRRNLIATKEALIRFMSHEVMN